MLHVKEENLLENYIGGALTKHRAGNEGSWLLVSVLPLRTDSFITWQIPKVPNTPEGATHLSAALWPWASHLVPLCRGLHSYKMRIITFADSSSHCQLSQYTGIFLEAMFFWNHIITGQSQTSFKRRKPAFVTFLLSLKSWKKWILKPLTNM